MANNALEIVVTDNKVEIQFTLKDSSGNAVNITGFTIKFSIRKHGSSTNTNNANNTCTLVTPTSGIFKYAFVSTDIPSAGNYLGQLHITFSDGKIHKVPTFIRLTGIESYL